MKGSYLYSLQVVVVQFVLVLVTTTEGNEPFHFTDEMRREFEALQTDSKILSSSNLILGYEDSSSSDRGRRFLAATKTSVAKEYDYPYKWVPCCDNTVNDAAKDYGDPKTNFMLPVTTSGPSYELFQGLTLSLIHI